MDVTLRPGSRGGDVSRVANIEVQLGELRQIFNAMDPAPFRERELDPNAEEYIVARARELPRDARLELVVRVTRELPTPDDVLVLCQAVREHFAYCASASRAELRRLFRVGRWTLVIGLIFVAGANLIGEFLVEFVGWHGGFLHESIVIGAWVALWHPINIFLYDWWPILGDARLYDRLSAMPVQVAGGQTQ